MRCGVTGLRPTYGRVPRTGAMTLCWSLDKLGPMTRSVEDAMLVLHAISGPDAGDVVERAQQARLRCRRDRGGAARRLLPRLDEGEPATDVDRAALEAVKKVGHDPGRGVDSRLALRLAQPDPVRRRRRPRSKN